MAVIYPVSLIEVLDGSELERFINEKRTLTLGDFLDGRVIKLFSENEALIDFGRFRAKALVASPMKEGELIRVMVMEAGEKIKFQIQAAAQNPSVDTIAKSGFLEKTQWLDLPGFQALFSRLTTQLKTGPETASDQLISVEPATILQAADVGSSVGTVSPQPPALQSLLQTMGSLIHQFRGIDLEGESSLIGNHIKTLVQDSGFFWENKVVSTLMQQTNGFEDFSLDHFDIKSFADRIQNMGQADIRYQLTTLLEKMKNIEAEAKPHSETAQRVGQIRSELEGFMETMLGQNKQILEETQQKIDNQVVFSFTLPFEQSRINGKMKLYVKSGKSRKKSSGWRIALLLNLSDLGGVRFDFYYLPQVLRLTIFVMDRKAQDEFLKFADELRERLSQYIETVHLDVLVSRKSIDHFESEDWVDEDGDKQLRLDIKA